MTQPDLFPEAVQLSPYLRFVERYQIVTGDFRKDYPDSQVAEEHGKYPDSDDDHYYYAKHNNNKDLDEATYDGECCYGRTEREAVLNLAIWRKLEGYAEVNWL